MRVRQFSLPPLLEPLSSGGLADSVYDVAARYPGLPQLSRRDPADPEQWHTVTARAFRDEVMALAKGLLVNGIGFGDRVALMARTRYEWTQFSYALWSIGAQVVPVYPTSSAEQVRWILTHSQVTAVVVEFEENAMTVGAACGDLPGLRHIWQLDDGCVARITAQGRRVHDEAVHRLRWTVEPGSVAVIAYTSGTTGRSKGCVITHANLAAECDTLISCFHTIFAEPGEQPSVLAFLPLSHIYGLMVQVSCLRGGVTLGHQPDIAPAALLPALASFRPTFLLAVPYIFEKIYEGARRNAERSGRARLFERAADVARRYAEAVERRGLGQGHGPGPMLRTAHAAFEHLVYARIRGCSAAGCATPSQAAPRCGATSPCSSPGPASPSTTATASPRPAAPSPPSPSTAPATAPWDAPCPAPPSTSPATARSGCAARPSSPATSATPPPPRPCSPPTAGSPPATWADSTRTAI